MKNRIVLFLISVIILIFVVEACKNHYFRENYSSVNEFLHDSKNLSKNHFIKIHYKNGDLCIFKNTWDIDTTLNTISGYGVVYDFNRSLIKQDSITVHFDQIALIETNKKINNPESTRIVLLSVLAAGNLAMTVYCIINPKACFGSCPTFYINESDNIHYADAEGFSSAILPSLEYTDIDALNYTAKANEDFVLTMKNEALETHCIREVKLLAFPKQNDEQIYHSIKDKFLLAKNIYPLAYAETESTNATPLLVHDDRLERFSLADSTNINSKEEIILYFENINNSDNLGLITNFRQTIMTTYFIYSAMGYMGDEVSDYFAKMETDPSIMQKLNNGMKKELGGIDCYVFINNKWEFQGSLNETGPIAINRQIIPFKANTSNIEKLKVKLVLNKGLWRLDYLALTNIVKEVEPIVLSPYQIIKNDFEDKSSLYTLNDSTKHLVSMPGDNFKLHFKIPKDNQQYDIMLSSTGYYLEWMRHEWLKDKDLLKLNDLVNYPNKFLKDEARNYKKYEKTMEETFWGSKITSKSLIYNEN